MFLITLSANFTNCENRSSKVYYTLHWLLLLISNKVLAKSVVEKISNNTEKSLGIIISTSEDISVNLSDTLFPCILFLIRSLIIIFLPFS